MKAGDVLDFDEKAPFLKAVRHRDEKRMRSVLGCGKNKWPGKRLGDDSILPARVSGIPCSKTLLMLSAT